MALVVEEGGARNFLPQGANMGDYVMTEGVQPFACRANQKTDSMMSLNDLCRLLDHRARCPHLTM